MLKRSYQEIFAKASGFGWPSSDFNPGDGCLPLGNLLNNGMVEKWNIGYEKRMMS
jgi:hypothetical protein